MAINVIVKAVDGSSEAVVNGLDAVETIEKLNNNTTPGLEPGKDDNEVVAHCPWCKTNYKDSLNRWVPTQKPAKDTMTETQHTPPDKNPLKKKQN